MSTLKSLPAVKTSPSVRIERRTAGFSGRPRPRELNHLFVNNVRFLSMFSIVAIHSWSVFGSTSSRLDVALITPFKFATIGFFLISGFLLGERVDRRNPVEYFMRRVKRVFVPWSFCFGILCVALVTYQLARVGGWHLTPAEMAGLVSKTVHSALYDTAFWFVPNLLVCIAILLLCRRHLYSVKLGLALLAADLVYGVNIYALWFPPEHTRAVFGFVFYLWLGSYAAQNFDKISRALARIPTAAYAALSVVTGIASYAETRLLVALHRPDALNSLRLSNQAFSIAIVLMIFRFSRATWPSFVDVRRHTFGIYLMHSLVLRPFLFLSKQLGHFDANVARDIEGVLVWFAACTLTYCICLAATVWLANQPALQWIVGATTEGSPKPLFVDVPGAMLPINPS